VTFFCIKKKKKFEKKKRIIGGSRGNLKNFGEFENGGKGLRNEI